MKQEEILDAVALFNGAQKDAVDHARWLTTLCLAEIAGLVAYIKLEAETVHLGWAIVIVVLALSAAGFVATILIHRHSAIALGKETNGLRAKLSGIKADRNLAQNQMDEAESELCEALLGTLQSYETNGRTVEYGAHILFGSATLVAGIALVNNELAQLIGAVFSG